MSSAEPLRARTAAIILAAGQGTRMKSATLPKAMFPLAGRPLIYFPVAAALGAGAHEVVVVVGHGRAEVERYLAATFGERVKTAVQAQQLGTGDAAKAGMTQVGADVANVVIFVGDVPLITEQDIARVLAGLEASPAPHMVLATCTVDAPAGYGRILRDGQGRVVAIKEDRDLKTPEERAIREINPAIYAAPRAPLAEALLGLTTNNAQGEYYLTDVVSTFAKAGRVIAPVESPADVLAGVNDRAQLAEAEAQLYARIHREHRLAGATLKEGARVDHGVVLGRDVVVETGCVLRGATRVGDGATLDVGCVLTDVVVEAGAVLKPYSVATSSTIGARAQVGPFSHMRPDSELGEEAHIGNFVEMKKTKLGKGAKANHLAYLGDGVVGAGANIGAGTIFCNYDGFKKHTTTIEDGAFIGSDSQLVAPVRVGRGAYVATGTTVTKDVPDGALAISRVKQENKEGYAERLKARLKAASGK